MSLDRIAPDLAPAPGGWSPAARIPDPAVRVLESSFEQCVLRTARVERLFTGCTWAEGPVWVADHESLLWSDVPNDRILRWDERNRQTSVFRSPARHANGNTRDREGRLITCESGARRLTRTEYDGTVTTLAEKHEGRRLNSPNDVVVAGDGAIWFTDPPFGILSDNEGTRAAPELPTNLYRIDSDTGRLDVAAGDIAAPNGLAFSPENHTLYVVESRAQPHRRILAYTVRGAALSNKRVLIDAGDAVPDGLRVDELGNLWCGWSGGEGIDGVRVFDPDGRAIGHVELPEACANVAFGGRRLSRIYMTATTSLYSLQLAVRGAR